MAQRQQLPVFTHSDYMAALNGAVDEARTKEKYKALRDISCRDIYEAEGFQSGLNVEIVDGHVKFALRNFRADPYEPLRDWTRDCLIDGWRLWRQDVQGGPFIPEDPELVEDVDFDPRGERVVQVCLDYDYDADGQGNAWPMPEGMAVKGQMPAPWHYHATLWIDTSGDAETYWRYEHRYPKGSSPDQYKPKVEQLEYFPYSGVRWDRGEGLMEPVKLTILRYENCMLEIAGENHKHSRRKMVGRGVGHFAKTNEEYADEGRMVIPQSADVFYPDPHAEAIKPMFEELELLENRIRNTLGLVKVADLHNASGTSRMVEILPNMATAELVREQAHKIMQLLHGPVAGTDYMLSFPPLIEYSPDDLTKMKVVLKEAASKEEGVISDSEYTERMRYLLGFPPVQAPQRTVV